MIQRIHGRRAFSILARDGRRIRRSSLWCSWCPQPNSNATRVAYSIGRACGPAVVRNRLRRRLRALLTEIDRTRPIPRGMLMIAARPQAAELTFGELRLELMRLLESIVPDLTNDSIARR